MTNNQPWHGREAPHKAPIRFLMRHLTYGTAGGFAFGAAILAFDIAGLGSMIRASSDGWLFALLLFFGLFVTFGSIGMGVGIMSLGQERD